MSAARPEREAAAGGRGPRAGPIFLERAGYRKRRLIDAIRLMPVLGAALWAVPLMWTRGESFTSAALLYLFGVWAVLVGLAALMSRGLRGTDWAETDAETRAATDPDEGG